MVFPPSSQSSFYIGVGRAGLATIQFEPVCLVKTAELNGGILGDDHIETGHGGWDTIAPSPVAFGANLPKVPREMSVQRHCTDSGCLRSGSQAILSGRLRVA